MSKEAIRELQEAIYGSAYLEGGKLEGILGDIEEIKERLSALEKSERSDWITVAQASRYLHISRTTFYELVKKGKIQLYRLDYEEARAVRVKRSDLDQLFRPVRS